MRKGSGGFYLQFGGGGKSPQPQPQLSSGVWQHGSQHWFEGSSSGQFDEPKEPLFSSVLSGNRPGQVITPELFSCRGASANPVERTHICTGTVIFFSHVTHICIIRLAEISPLASIHVSRDTLFVAKRQLNPEFDISVKRGINAELLVLGMHSSKKLVSTKGCVGFAILTSAHTVIVLSLPQLSHSARSKYTMIFPHIRTFCVPKIGVPPGQLSSQSLVSANNIFSEGTPSGPIVSTMPLQLFTKHAPDIPVSISRVRLSQSDEFSGLNTFLHLISMILLTVQPRGTHGVNLSP